MTRYIRGRRFFFAAYAVLAAVFLTVHFTRVDTCSTVVGEIEVQCSSSIGTSLAPAQIRRLKIYFKGLEFLFRRGNKAVITTSDGIRHSLNITDWSYDENTVTVTLENNAGFILSLDSHGTGIALTPVIPVTVPPVVSLELPLRPEGSTSVSMVKGKKERLEISYNDRDFIASLPSESSWNWQKKRLNLVVLNKAEPVVMFSEDGKGGGLDVNEWFSQQAPLTDSAYESALDNWISLSREGWRLRRNSRSGLWTGKDGSVKWSNRLAAVLLSDAVSRNQISQVLPGVFSAAENASQDINWLPSPYLGNIVNQTSELRRSQRTRAIKVISALKENSIVPDINNTLELLVNRGDASEARQLLEVVRGDLNEAVSNAELAARISILQEAKSLFMEGSDDASIREKLFDKNLLHRISWVWDGLWLLEDDGSIDLSLSIKAGLLLLEEARRNNSLLYQAAGRQLILSALNYADESGIIPKYLYFEGNGEVVAKGKILPEEIFAEISGLKSFPRQISLARELGKGAWAFTAAEELTVRSSPRETSITMDFPPGGTHHLAVHGIKPFNRFHMQGIDWNSDPHFQRYYTGWRYDENTQTLYVKILHRARTEVIRLYYYDEEGDSGKKEETPADGS